MKKFAKIGLIFSVFAAAVMPVFMQNNVETASAATLWKGSATGYTKASDVNYVKNGKYVLNWGARDEACTFLTSYATNFYTGSYSYEQMSLNAGSSSTSSVPSSALYKALNNMVTSEQTYTTSYNATRDLFCYTDCVNSNSTYISSFYSANRISGEWDGGDTWNREHTWPNSKGDANGQGENDIMMLRPTAKSENGSRGNKAYGESGSYYNPKSEGQNVQGDCARIILYVYTRWGTQNMWGTGGVMESKDVLLKWMQEDPVDTWEMGRNDATEAITGTRNVYVDYPEYAWLLFGEEVPSNMVTPSGKASGGTATPDIPINPNPDTPVEPDVPANPTTQAEIVAAAYALASGETLGSYTLTGKINNVKEYDSAKYTICLTINVEGKDFYCYWMRDNANGDNASLAVGDTITVTGTIKNYNGTVEFDKPTLGTVVKGGNGGSTTPDVPDTPVNPDPNPDVPDTPVNPDPNPDVTPDPVISGLEEGNAYVVSATNASGLLYLTDSITSGRFDCSTSASDAVYVYVENVEGGQLLYMLNGSTKNYFVFEDSASGGSMTTSAASATIFEWNAALKTLVVAEDGNNRAFGSKADSTYTSFSAYDANNADYVWGQFTLVKAAQPDVPDTPDTPDIPDAPDTPDVPDAPDVPGEEESKCPGHKFKDWEVVTPATAESEGLEERTCKFCGATEERTIPALTEEDSTVDGETSDTATDSESSGMLGGLTAGCQASIGASMAGMALLTAGFALLKRKKENE
ncbi:MAG: endonuclease [Clostridia bacterium]|nr:endonuclease [Clostridia bacterium]